MAKAVIHVLSKDNISQQTLVSLPPDLPYSPLSQSSVRVRTTIIGLTANNHTYARLGSALQWWDCYPVPQSAPAPFNDALHYGTVPAWGYAVVLESTSSITPGTVLWGYLPISTVPTDLRLAPAAVKGDWLETSEHRKPLRPIYQRYIAYDPAVSLSNLSQEQLNAMAWTANLRPVWECGYLLNRFVYSPDKDTLIYYSGSNTPWTPVDSDLTSAVVVNLAASSKTARSFDDQFANARPAGTGPLGVLSVTSSASRSLMHHTSSPSKTVSYSELTTTETLNWITALRPKRIILIDFGGPEDSAQKLLETLEVHSPTLEVTFLSVAAGRVPAKIAQMAICDTSGLRSAALERVGEERYFQEMQGAFQAWLDRGGPLGMKLVWGDGMRGDQGIEGFWKRLCKREVAADIGMVFRFL